MRTVYVTQQGGSLRREGGLLSVFTGGSRVAEFSVDDLQQLVLMGNVVLTPAALGLLVERGVDTVLLTQAGRYRGRIVGGPSRNVRLRLAQYRMLTSTHGALELARAVVIGKVSNQRGLLLRYARRVARERAVALARAGTSMRAALEHARLAEDLEELRGCEGAASAAYFRVFGLLISAPGFRFEGRNRRPPMDPVNALLSLGYTLLHNAVEGAIHVVGLDPFIGALHAEAAGRPSLACDLVEEFRAPLVDALVLAAINRGAIKPDQFEECGPGEPVVMKREAVRGLVEAWERRLEARVLYAPTGSKLAWRQVIEQQVRRAARHVLGEEPYEAWIAR